MIIFKILEDLITDKKNDVLKNSDDEKEFVPFLVQRWLSMYSPGFATILNKTVNRHWHLLQTKEEWYRYFTTVIPRSPRRRINYIKKNKEAKVKGIDKIYIEELAQRLELSHKEIKDYIEVKGLTNSELKKILGVNKDE